MPCPTLAELPPAPAGRTGWPWTVETPQLPDTMPNGAPWQRISIVTPSYNQGQFIEETIRSVLLQAYPVLEYIIIDGGSTDGSIDIIRKYEPWLSHWVSEPDDGQSDAINKGFGRSTGEILNWLNSDDFLAEGALMKIGRGFSENPNAGAVLGRGHKIDIGRNILVSPQPPRVTEQSLLQWCYGGTFMQPACYFTRRAWESSGPIRTDLHFCMDLALWYEISRRFEFAIIREDIACAYAHAAAKTTAERELMFAEIALYLATVPGGFAVGRRILSDLFEGKLIPKPPQLSVYHSIRRRAGGIRQRMMKLVPLSSPVQR